MGKEQKVTRTDLHSNKSVFVGIELSNKKWKLVFSNLAKEREVNMPARNRAALRLQIERAKEKLGAAADATVYSCYEAGRDGFWIHRMLEAEGVENIVVDPASIEVSRHGRRRKTDRLDAKKLVRCLIRHVVHQEKKVWHVVRVPEDKAEDERRLHRERKRLLKERNAHTARMKSLLVLQGIAASKPQSVELEGLRDWRNKPLAEHLLRELKREQERWQMINEQIKQIEAEQQDRIKAPRTLADEQSAKLMKLKSVGIQTAWMMSKEVFGWRKIMNRRQLGALAGLTGTPHDSGNSQREQGISKAGNRMVRTGSVELAWLWLRHQPDSELSRWFWRRFGNGNKRMRRIGIVALARKLLVALWKYLEFDEVPEGAIVAG